MSYTYNTCFTFLCQNGSSDSDQVAELVKHNQQLAERVLRLRQDKDDLTNSLTLLESRLKANVGRDKKEKVVSCFVGQLL